jgi:hypothetical protein
MRNPEMDEFTPEQQPKKEKSRYVVGAKQNPDGSWDYSEAMVMLSEEESQEAVERAKQREEIISGKIKKQIEANPNAIVDVEQARKYWGRLFDEAGQGDKLEMQLNEIYAQKYEEAARLARERMMELEQKLNDAKSEDEKQALLVKIVEERDFAKEMEQEASHRRSY